jgi:hypothetical protein
VPSSNNQISQELRLTSPTGRFLEFISCVYYYRRHSNDVILLSGPFGGLAEAIHGPGASISFSGGRDQTRYTVNSVAAYADGPVNLSDKLSVILGGADPFSMHSRVCILIVCAGIIARIIEPGCAARCRQAVSCRKVCIIYA